MTPIRSDDHAVPTRRSLIRRPGFTALAVGALALGVGGTTAVYSLVHHVLIDGLPYEEPDRLVTPDVPSLNGFVLLLVGAGLLARSLHRLAAVEKGFVSENVVTARLQAPEGTFEAPEPRHVFYDALAADLKASPDIVSAAATLLVPLVPRSWERVIAPEGAWG